jgi:hypothetical protein
LKRSSIAALAVLAAALSGCHSMSTELVGVDANAPDADVATVWADNTPHAFMEIRRADGRRTSSFWTDSTSPYSIRIAPGHHVLTVFFEDVAPAVAPTFPPVTSASTKVDVDVDLLPGHAYALRHMTGIDGRRVWIAAVDLGAGKRCHYEQTGNGMRGYVAVALRCE